jgi:heme A synthase
MENRWLHLYALLVVTGTVYLEVTGAIANSQEGAPVTGHRAAAVMVGVLVVGLVVWLLREVKRGWLRRLGLVALAGMVAEGGLGELAGRASPMTNMAHAFLAPLLVSALAAIALGTSRSWQHEPIWFEDQGKPPLRNMARNTLILVVIQVALGAAFRYGAIGVMVHIMGALLAAVFVLMLVVLVTIMPTHPTLRPAAIALGVVTFAQIFLGLTVVNMGSANATNAAAVAFAVAHVVNGAVVLATTLVLALEIWRNVRPATHD